MRDNNIPLSYLDLTVRTTTVLKHLGITTLDELKQAKLPEVGAVVFQVPIANVRLIYTNKVQAEINLIFKNYGHEATV